MRKEKYDVVHVHTPAAAAVGRVAAWLGRVPIILYTVHGFYFHEHMPWYVRRPIVWIEKLLGHMTDMVLTTSLEDAATAVRERICSEEWVRYIGQGIDIGRFAHGRPNGHLRSAYGLAGQDRVVGFVGRLVREKGVIELIKAMQRVSKEIPSAKLLLVGDSLKGERDRGTPSVVHELIEKSELKSRVVRTGFIDDVPAAMAAMDLFVLPSYREGMPVSILEAMASGKPVVATNIRGCREEVVHGVTGLLVPPKDPAALAHAIVQVLSNPALAAKMGAEGRERAVKLFDESQVLERQVDAYRRLVETKLTTGVATN